MKSDIKEAILNKDISLLKELISDININLNLDDQGQNPLILSFLTKQKDLALLLEERKAFFSVLDFAGNNLFYYFLKDLNIRHYKNIDIVYFLDLLKNKNINLNHLNDKKIPMIYYLFEKKEEFKDKDLLKLKLLIKEDIDWSFKIKRVKREILEKNAYPDKEEDYEMFSFIDLLIKHKSKVVDHYNEETLEAVKLLIEKGVGYDYDNTHRYFLKMKSDWFDKYLILKSLNLV